MSTECSNLHGTHHEDHIFINVNLLFSIISLELNCSFENSSVLVNSSKLLFFISFGV